MICSLVKFAPTQNLLHAPKAMKSLVSLFVSTPLAITKIIQQRLLINIKTFLLGKSLQLERAIRQLFAISQVNLALDIRQLPFNNNSQ